MQISRRANNYFENLFAPEVLSRFSDGAISEKQHLLLPIICTNVETQSTKPCSNATRELFEVRLSREIANVKQFV